MAATLLAARLTEAHRLAQARAGAQLVAQMRALWSLIDPDDIDGTFERWLQATIPAVQAQRTMSTQLAAGYLAAFRRLELDQPLGRFTATLAASADVAAVTTSLLVTGPYSLKSALGKGTRMLEASDIAQARSAAAGMRHALDGGRETVLATVEADEKAHGWARATSGRACAFCAMLASRGPAYGSQATAGFKSHDGCHCTAEPAYSLDAAWPAGSERYRQLWDTHTAGHSGKDAVNAFRRALTAA